MIQTDRAVVFLDSWHLNDVSRALNFNIDYVKLLSFFDNEDSILRAYFYTNTTYIAPNYDDDEIGRSSTMKFNDFLSYNGYDVVQAMPRFVFNHDAGKTMKLPDYYVNMALDMIDLAPTVERFYIASNSNAILPVLDRIKKLGVGVTLISTKTKSQDSFFVLNQALTMACDEFIEIAGAVEKLSKDDT